MYTISAYNSLREKNNDKLFDDTVSETNLPLDLSLVISDHETMRYLYEYFHYRE